MIIREFKAKIVTNFKREWLGESAMVEGSDVETEEAFYGGVDLDTLSDRISGNIVTITENQYPCGDNDFFEKEDNNFVIFPSLFDEI